MEKNAKREKLECREPPSPEINMANKVNSKSSSFCVTTSCNNSESAGDSPILETTKIRRKGKLWMTRRAVSDSGYSTVGAKLSKHKEMQHTWSTVDDNKNLESFSKSQTLTRCLSCDSTINADRNCQNCSDGKLASRRSSCLKRELVDRLRDLKHCKKPAARISDLKGAQIPEEEFVESVRMLDKACDLTPSVQVLRSPMNHLGLVTFVKLEHLSSLEQETQMNSLPVTHLSLDEDKEEDMFADTKDSTEAVEDFEGFRQWKYNAVDMPASLFHGFSTQECVYSRDIADRGSQFRELDQLDEIKKTSCFRGFPSTDIDKSANLLKDWKLLLRNIYLDSKSWEDWFIERLEIESDRNLNNIREDADGVSCTKASENQFFADSGQLLAAAETISKPEAFCSISISTINELGNMEFSTDCRKQLGTRESIMKTEILPPMKMKNIKEESIDDDKLGNLLSSQSNYSFSTAGGRPIRVSEAAITKAKLLLSQEIEIIKDEPLDNRKYDNILDWQSKCKRSTAGGISIRVSETNLAKAETGLRDENESIKDELLNERKLDNLQDSRNRCGFLTAGGRPIGVSKTALAKAEIHLSEEKDSIKDELFGYKLDNVLDLRSNCGFSTTDGRPICISETAISKAEALLSKDIEAKMDDSRDDCKSNDTPEPAGSLKFSGSQGHSEFSTARGRPIRISETAINEAQQLYSALDDCEAKKIAESPPKNTTEEMENECKISISSAAVEGRELKISEALLFRDIEANMDGSRYDCKSNDTPESVSSLKLSGSQDYSGFSTARGCPIRISESAINKAERLYSELDDCETKKIAERLPNRKKEEMKNECKISFGFATAGGRKLKISEESWSKAKALFNAIEEACVADLAERNRDPDSLDTEIIVSRDKTETVPSDLSTVSDRSINVATEAVSMTETQLFSYLDNMESLDFEDFIDPVEKSEISNKRKFEEIDEDTPLKRDAYLKRKRGRYVNDLQARKLFNENSDNDDEVERTKRMSEFVGLNRISPEKNMISEEVDASAAALLEDEKRSNEETIWRNNALLTDGSISPEFGCEVSKRLRADVSTRNLLGVVNRAELEKVNDDGGGSRDLNSSHAASGSSTETKENIPRVASAGKREEHTEIQPESIPDDLTFDSQFSQDIQHSPVIDKFITETLKIMEGRLAIASKQDEAIRGKRRTKPEPCDGFLYQLRTSNRNSRTSWQQLTEGIAPAPREISSDSLGRDILSITANSAVHYRFRCADFYGEKNVRRNIEGIKVGDGASLILDEKNCVGAREFERAFLASPGVDPNLVPTGWVRNHYRWIVWKLASMDRVKFGHKCLPRMLTLDRVMFELKYRYDREIYRTQWPPLRRILERGEDASARLVLCVSSIVAEEDENAPIKGSHTPNSLDTTMYKMKVTDGWYSIATSIDVAMINLIKSGKVREGTKLMIFGAKAVNLDQGCSALEIPEAVTLRIYSNSVRRARWNTKLDYYYTNRGPMSLSLKSVKPNGGAICKLVVAVSRVYPILYREKLPDGQCVFRNARCDEEAARAHEARCQSKIEEIYANAWSEFQICSMSRKKGGSTTRRTCTQEEVEAYSKDMEEELRQRISSKMSECLPTPRDVTPVMKIRIAEADTCALMTVWSADRDTMELFVEGSSISISNAFASGLRLNELHITAGRNTFVKRENSQIISYPERIYTSLSDITEPGFNPVYGEFDTIGIVSSTGPAPHGMKNFETVNLACPRPGDATRSDFLSILFWQGVSAHGYTKILTVGSLVACSNLEWRRNTSRSIPTAYCTERSVFSKNPRQNHLIQAFESLRNEIKERLAYATACATVIENEIVKKLALRTPGGGGTPYKPAMSSSRTPGWSPRDLTSSNDTNCTTPRINSKKASTRKRLEQLEVYGEPPKLPSIVINNSSRKVLSDFRSPVFTPATKP